MKKMAMSPTNRLYSKPFEYQFGAGDPALDNHPAILEAARLPARSPYAPVAGLLELRKAAADWMNRRYGSEYESENVLVTCGGKFALFAALKMLLEEGDEVLVAAPYWPSYPQMIEFCGGKMKVISTSEEKNWKIFPSDLKGGKVLILNHPCNPTGAVYTRHELEALLEARPDLIIIADEVYSELVYDGVEFVSLACMPKYKDRILIVESCSKNFAMAGWRVGFAIGPKEWIETMAAIQSQTTTGTSLIAQKAALGALTHSEEVAAYVRHHMDLRRKLFYQTFNQLMGTHLKLCPAGIYLFYKVGGDSLKICEEILQKGKILCIPGIVCGTEGYIRFAFTESEENIVKGLKELYNRWHG